MADLSFTTKPLTGALLAPAFHSMPDAMLADAIGELDCRAKACEAEVKSAREALKARGVVRRKASASPSPFPTLSVSLDTAVIRAEMGENWCDDRSKPAEIVTMRVTVHKAALAIAA